MDHRHALLRRAGGIAAALALIGSSVALLAAPAAAGAPARYVAKTNTDGTPSSDVLGGAPNDCTVQATPCLTIQHAVDVAADGDTISIEPGVYAESLTLSLDDLTLVGAGSASTVVTGSTSGGAPIIDDEHSVAAPGSLTLQDLSLSGESAAAPNSGDGVYVYDTALTMTDVVVSNNAGDGVDGYEGTTTLVSLIDSTVSDNGGSGVWFSDGSTDLNISGSTVSGNAGAGVEPDSGSTHITASSIIGNSGGGVVLGGGTADITESTIADNTGQGVVVASGAATITDSTITGTQAGGQNGTSGGLVLDGSDDPSQPTTVSVTGSIVGGQVGAAPDCVATNGVVQDGGYNMSSDAADSCGFTAVADGGTDVTKTNPHLGPLALDAGSPTSTADPLAGSAAIDAIPYNSGTCTGKYTTDQRLFARPQPAGGACDIGAVEVQPSSNPAPPTCPALVIDTDSLPDGTVGQPYSQPLAAHGGCDNDYTWALAPSSSDTTAANPTESPAVRHLTRPAAPALDSAATPTPTPTSTSTPIAGLPAGISLSTAGVLSGTPTQAGDFAFTVSVNDPAFKTLTLHVNAPAATSSAAPTASPTPKPSPSSGVSGVSAHRAASASAPPLAETGTPVRGQLWTVGLLLGAGAALLLAARSRRRPRRAR